MMATKSNKKQPEKSQHDIFKQAAKDNNCDEKTDLKKIIKKISKTDKLKQK
jgi:hypothetical protein